VHEKVSTGIAKLNSDYLGATQRWAEGAVQLFWIHFFVDRSMKLWLFLTFILALYAFFYFFLYIPEAAWPWLFCSPYPYHDLLAQPVCNYLEQYFATYAQANWSNEVFLNSATDFCLLMDFAILWTLVCVGFTALLVALSFTHRLPSLVRAVIMFENSTYFWSSPTVFFWVGLSAYMIIFNASPFHFRVVDWMTIALAIMVCKYVMQQRMKSLGNCDEMSIWRSQQMFFVGGPLHVMSLCQGTKAAYKIYREHIDKSFWSAADHGQQVVTFVKVWTGGVLVACVLCTAILVIVSLLGYTVGASQWVALILLLAMGFTIISPVTDIWGKTGTQTRWRREMVAFPSCKCRCRWPCGGRSSAEQDTKTPLVDIEKEVGAKKAIEGSEQSWCMQFFRWTRQKIFSFFYWLRCWSWVVRWLIDLGLPLVVLIVASQGAQNMIGISAWAQAMGGAGVR